MFGGHHHEGGSEQGVRPGRKHLKTGAAIGLSTRGPSHIEAHGGARGAADPVALHGFDPLGPIQAIQVVDQTVGIGRDAHHPLAEVAPEHREVAALGQAFVGDLFVGDHRAQAGGPVDGSRRHVRQAVVVQDAGLFDTAQLRPRLPTRVDPLATVELFDQHADGSRAASATVRADGRIVIPTVVDLGEDPLGPAVVVGVDSGEAATRFVPQTQLSPLRDVGRHVGFGGGARVLTRLHGKLLGGQTEGVKTHRVEHVLADGALVATVDVG